MHFIDTDLRGADLTGAKLIDCDFRDAKSTSKRIEGATIVHPKNLTPSK